MWMIRPYVVREVTIDLPALLVESLGVGAEMLAQYLTELAEAGVNDPANHPPPLPILCRICERQITPWWFEKHTTLCLQEHTAEMDVQLAHESLAEHRTEIVKVLDGLDAQSRQPRATSSGETTAPAPSPPEYKGHLIGPASTPSSAPSSGPSSGRASPASPSRSRDRSTSSFGHNRARSFAIRRPVARIVELVLDLCDTALEINTPALVQTRAQQDGEFRTQSPQSENRISQVMQWHSPSTSTVEQEQGLAVLCEDTAKLARNKVDAIFRHRHILEYSERIRIEFTVLVQECIEAAMEKAARIAAGDISDSSDDTEGQDMESHRDMDQDLSTDERPGEEAMFPGSFEGQSSMSIALRNISNPSLISHSERRDSSAAASTRSSSPRGSQTPRSLAGISNLPPPSKRGSIYFESDTGADSDSSMISSAVSVPRRAESPGSDLSLSRVHSSRERKRRSLILPSVMSSRQHSPARSIPPPSSPLRMAKSRIPSGNESSQSPVTSPVLATSEFSSPSIMPQHLQQHHRRQSSAASSEVFRAPTSPRLAPVSSNPQPRAVPPSIKDFEIIKPISKGAFGSVYLSKKKSTGDYFAIKVLKKADMVAKNQVTNVKAERAIMMWQGESDFVAKLYWTFSSKDYLYLVMEYLNGGDCASLIKVLGGLPEDWSRKYMAEVVLGVQHLHSRGIVHRDLKPDNLLIDQKGHLKLTDFGLSRMGLVGRQKRALNSKSDDPPAPDLLKQGPFHRAVSVGSSRSASFDMQGNYSPSQTPSLTAAIPGDIGQPSYFSLTRESSRKTSGGNKTDSETSEGLNAMLRKFSLADDGSGLQAQSPIEEETTSGEASPPELFPLQTISSNASIGQGSTPPTTSNMLPPTMALFDPQDTSRKFVGTPDYLAPETINGIGQDEVSDWWSVGCILFEVLYGFAPFQADSPEEVFQNILARKIAWPPEDDCPVSPEAMDLMNKLMCLDPAQRLGANAEEKFANGGDEVRNHPWFGEINWETLREDEASFVPNLENPEDTEYFDARGATLTSFAAEFEDQAASPAGTPGADYPERPHDATSLSRVRTQVNSIKRGLMPLHIPPHVRDGRTRRLSEPVATDDFGNFSFKNLPVLEKANKDVIQKLRAEALQAQTKPGSALNSPAVSSPSPSLESSPVLPMPLKRTMSATKGPHRPSSPLLFTQPTASPNRISQPSSPLLVQFSAGQHHERRKASSGSSSLSHQGSHSSSLQPGNFFDAPRMMASLKTTSSASSPIKLAKSPGSNVAHERSMSAQRLCGPSTSPRPRSHTVSSQESEDIVKDLVPNNHHKRRSQVVDISPSSSDNEDGRQKAAFLRVQRRRQSSRRMSQITLEQGPMFRPLDVLVCEDHPVSRLVMEKLLEKHRCRTITAQSGPEAMRYAMSEVKFDIIMMEYKLPQINGADVARMIRDTKNANTNTPIVCVTGYLKELPPSHHFDGLIDKPPTLNKLGDMLSRLCQWKPPPANWTPAAQYASMPLSGLRQESGRTGDSPTSNGSSYGANPPSGSYRGSSREDSISSSFFGDTDSRTDDVAVIISKHSSEDWHDRDLAQAFDGLGITESMTESKPIIPSFIHQESAPAAMEHSLVRKKPSAERVGEKRRSIEQKRRDSAESGDDEDEELGNAQLRARSPKGGRPRGSSKLGTEMLRTNSRGSVVSVEDISITDVLPNSPPPMIAEEPAETKTFSLTPPELFPRLPGAAVEEIEMDPSVTTPKPPHHDTESPDPDPTPRPSISSTSWPSPMPVQSSPSPGS
jgi:serine/threonine-protein kinase RIM15